MHPQYIEPICLDCQSTLVPLKTLENEAWDDEWACPQCYDGDSIYVDMHPAQRAELERRLKEIEEGAVESLPWDQIKKKFLKEE